MILKLDRYPNLGTLVAAALIPALLLGQSPASGGAQPMAQLPMTQSLKILPLAGNNEQNDLQRRVMAPLVVQVLDQNSRPVEGAQVTFRFPVSGPAAAFAGGKNSQTFVTNADGQVAATGWIANGETGRYPVKVTAVRRNEMGEATLYLENVTTISNVERAKAKKSIWTNKWTWIVIAGAAGGAAGGILATRGNGGGSSAVVISPGNPTVGGR
jgi:hypothetical protein